MNPATRILEAIKAASAVPSNQNSASAQRWALSLLRPDDVGKKKLDEIDISQRLVALTDQVSALCELLRRTECPSSLYHNHLLTIKRSFSPSRTHEAWSSVSQGFKEENLVTLRWAEWLVGPLETALNDDDRNALDQQIADLETFLVNDSLPTSLQRVLQAQVSELRNALRRYSIEGISPLKKAVKTITADIVSEQEMLTASAESQPKETKQALSKLQSAMSTTVTVIDKATKTASNIGKLWTMGKHVIEQLPL